MPRPTILPSSSTRICSAWMMLETRWATITKVAPAVVRLRAWRSRGTATEGWELAFTGSGYVIVQPSEMLPPQRIPLR